MFADEDRARLDPESEFRARDEMKSRERQDENAGGITNSRVIIEVYPRLRTVSRTRVGAWYIELVLGRISAECTMAMQDAMQGIIYVRAYVYF